MSIKITLEERNELGNYVPVATAPKETAWVLVSVRSARTLARYSRDCRRHGPIEVYEEDDFNCPICLEEEVQS